MAGKGAELQRTFLTYLFCTSATSAAGVTKTKR